VFCVLIFVCAFVCFCVLLPTFYSAVYVCVCVCSFCCHERRNEVDILAILSTLECRQRYIIIPYFVPYMLLLYNCFVSFLLCKVYPIVVYMSECALCRWGLTKWNTLLHVSLWCCDWADHSNSWTASDSQLDCVSVKVDTQKLQSMDCSTVLPFACVQLPGSGKFLLTYRVLRRQRCRKTWCRSKIISVSMSVSIVNLYSSKSLCTSAD